MKFKMYEDSKSQEFCASKKWVSILKANQKKTPLIFLPRFIIKSFAEDLGKSQEQEIILYSK